MFSDLLLLFERLIDIGEVIFTIFVKEFHSVISFEVENKSKFNLFFLDVNYHKASTRSRTVCMKVVKENQEVCLRRKT